MKPYLMLWLVLIVVSCVNTQKHQPPHTKLLNFGTFTIVIPDTWKRVNAKGIDSYVGEIHTPTKHIISFDLGWYSNPLTEGSEDFVIRNDSLLVLRESLIKTDHKNYDYRGQPDSNVIATLTVNKKEWLIVDGYRAKLITPSHPGKGTTGLYIDSLWDSNGSKDRFQINAENLSGIEQKQFIEALKSLKFYQHGRE